MPPPAPLAPVGGAGRQERQTAFRFKVGRAGTEAREAHSDPEVTVPNDVDYSLLLQTAGVVRWLEEVGGMAWIDRDGAAVLAFPLVDDRYHGDVA